MAVVILSAVALVLIAAGLISIPLLKSRPSLNPALWIALVCTGVVMLGITTLYASLSNGSVKQAPKAGSPQSMVVQLARHLRSHPDDLAGWMMLGRSYIVFKEYPRAEHAYRQADRLSGGTDADALLGEAQAMMLIDGRQLTGRAGNLVERALALSPTDPEALYFGAIVAMHRGQLALARARFSRLLTLDPPAHMRNVVREQIASIDQQLGNSPPVPIATGAMIDRAGAHPAVIRVRLQLAPTLAARAPHDAPLFVFVRDPAQPGPPLAVKRLTSRFPQTVTLTPADSMIPGRTFTTGERVEVVARVAPSGNPLDARGDLSGRATYRVGRDGQVNILINRVSP